MKSFQPNSSGEDEHLNNVLRISALALILYASSNWVVEAPAKVLLGSALVWPKLLRSRLLWGACALLLAGASAYQFDWIDNHKHLASVWCFACCLACTQLDDAGRFLQIQSRILLAIVFTLAVFWKLAGGEYIDGSFWEFTLLTDRRVEWLSVACGLSVESLRENRDIVYGLRTFYTPDAQTLTSNLCIDRVGGVVSIATLVGEGAIAASLVAAAANRCREAHNYLLIAFVVLTYVFLPVTAFGTMLGVMGFAQAESTRMRIAFLLAIAVVQFSVVPVDKFLLGLFA